MSKNIEVKKVVEVKEKRSFKVNLNFINFINELINSKIDINKNNKLDIEKKYKELVNLKFNNMSKISSRNNRKEVIKGVNSYLSSKNIDLNKYKEIEKKVVNISKKRVSNYMRIEV